MSHAWKQHLLCVQDAVDTAETAEPEHSPGPADESAAADAADPPEADGHAGRTALDDALDQVSLV